MNSGGYREVAVDPEAFIQEPSAFSSILGADRGRLLRLIDKNWVGRVIKAAKAAGLPSQKQHRFIEKARQLQERHGINPAAMDSDLRKKISEGSWVTAALAEHRASACDDIVCVHDCPEGSESVMQSMLDYLDSPGSYLPKLRLGFDDLFERAEPILKQSQWIVIEDSFLDSGGGWRAVGLLVEAARNATEVTLVTTNKSGSDEAYISPKLAKWIPRGRKTRVQLFDLRGGQPYPHKRWVLSEHGGFDWDKGLSEFSKSPSRDIPSVLISREQAQLLGSTRRSVGSPHPEKWEIVSTFTVEGRRRLKHP